MRDIPDLITTAPLNGHPPQVEQRRHRRWSTADYPVGDAWGLVAAAQCGDREAFGLLYDRYAEEVFRFVLFRVRDRGLAEDLTGETFLRAWRWIGSVSDQGRDVGAWLVTIARNLVLDHVRSSRYRCEVLIPDLADIARPAEYADSVVERAVIAAEDAAEVLRCVAQLGGDQQECIRLRFLTGLSVAQTAAAMDRTDGAVKALQHRAVRRLAALLPRPSSTSDIERTAA